MGNSVNIGREQLLDLIESVILENKNGGRVMIAKIMPE